MILGRLEIKAPLENKGQPAQQEVKALQGLLDIQGQLGLRALHRL